MAQLSINNFSRSTCRKLWSKYIFGNAIKRNSQSKLNQTQSHASVFRLCFEQIPSSKVIGWERSKVTGEKDLLDIQE